MRLIGAKPKWARSDGGEAGLHPSNIHDNAYAIGTVDFTGDMPVILGPDGPSLGGFVCPATLVKAELWKLGQLRPNNRIRFKRMTPDDAFAAEAAQDQMFESLQSSAPSQTPIQVPHATRGTAERNGSGEAVLARLPARGDAPAVVYRRAGDKSRRRRNNSIASRSGKGSAM